MPRVKTVGRAKWRSAQTEYLSKADDQSQIGYPPFALEEISPPPCLLLADTTLPASRRKAAARRVEGFLRAAAGTRSDFDLLRDLQGIVDLDTEVPDCRFQPMPEKSSHDSPEQSPSKSHQGGCDAMLST